MLKRSDDYFADIELVGDAIRLLIGDRDEDFALERALRLFQLKCWLIDRIKLIHSFNRSKKIFALLSISVAERSRRFTLLTPSERLALLYSSKLQGLINYAFKDKDFFTLMRIRWQPFRSDDVKPDYDEIKLLNNYTRLRFRLYSNKNILPSRNNADVLFGIGTLEPYCSESKIKTISRDRRCRELFLFVLETKYPNFLQFGTNRAKAHKQLMTDCSDKDLFRKLFGMVKYLASILDEDLSEILAEFWSHLEPQEIAPLEPLTQHQLDVAGIKPTRRRSAETTKLAARQMPIGSK
jgi:hypothetical protein